MLELANAYLTIMRGTEDNDAGDETDVGIPIYRHVPALLIETTQKTYDRASQTRRTIRTIKCTVPPYTDIDDDDTLMNEITDPPAFYMIEQIVRQPTTIGAPANLILTLRARSGISVATD